MAVTNAHGTAKLALQGAQVLSWTPHGQLPVIWLSPVAKFASGKLIRGGVPVCWPWFGPHPTQASFPGHGFARIVPWELVETQRLADSSTRIVFRLVQSEYTLAQWPHSTPVELYISVGVTLEIDLVTRNIGQSPVTIGGALHSYFQVSDIRHVTIYGLDACPYLDKVSACQRKQQAGPVTISAETDHIYLDAIADCLIEDPVLNRRIRIGKRGSRSTVVWNPWVD
ncbi:MAG TPA: D-hexose-6-phosphate mutarotase [Terriglobales bacterium]|nr:D-hexose-6-phosphate mutarotase [Terriglobales bacterium]